jgi:type III secretion protein T
METLLGYVALAAVAIARVTAMILVLPVFTRLGLTGMLRTAVAFALALPIIPHMTPSFASVLALGGGSLLVIIAKEAALGLLLGLAFGIPFWAAQSAGDVIDTQRGAAIAYMVEPTAMSEVSITGTFLELTMLALFFVGGGPNLVIGAVYDSLLLWPILAPFPAFQGDAAGLLLGILDRVLRTALLIGGPIVLVLFLVEAATALISRISPQLPMSDLSLPIKGIAVFAVLPIYVVFLIDQAKRSLGELGGVLPELGRYLQ